MIRRALICFTLVVMLFMSMALPVLADDDNDYVSTKFIYMLDGKNIADFAPDMVIGSKNFFIIHNQGIIYVTYTTENRTIFNNKPYQNGIISFPMEDNSHLVIMNSNHETLVDSKLHVLNVENFFLYVFPLKYQQIAVSIILAFFVSLFAVYVLFVTREQRIL